jgi:hypothetical protein
MYDATAEMRNSSAEPMRCLTMGRGAAREWKLPEEEALASENRGKFLTLMKKGRGRLTDGDTRGRTYYYVFIKEFLGKVSLKLARTLPPCLLSPFAVPGSAKR